MLGIQHVALVTESFADLLVLRNDAMPLGATARYVSRIRSNLRRGLS
jgi:hypothetical protein